MLLHLRIITLHGVKSKSLKLGRHSHSKRSRLRQEIEKFTNKAENEEFKAMQSIVNKAAV